MAGAAAAVLLLFVSSSLADVGLFYVSDVQVSGSRSPLQFIDGANYASASAQGFVTVSFATSQQVSLTASVKGGDGAYGTYLLDVIEVEALTNTSTGWHLEIDVTRALAATGVNAAYLFDCLASPTAVPDSGVALASGTDAAGDPWAVFSPTCAGTQEAISLQTAASGTGIAIPPLTYGVSALYLSFAVDVASGGATTTTSATITLLATSP
jgi:hypothetical protein